MDDAITVAAVVGILVLVVVLVILGPILLIWSLNGLFHLGLAYTFKNWLYAFVLGLCLGGSGASRCARSKK